MENEERARRRLEALRTQYRTASDFGQHVPQTEGVGAFGIADSTLKTLGPSQPGVYGGAAPGTFESLGGRVGRRVDDRVGVAQGVAQGIGAAARQDPVLGPFMENIQDKTSAVRDALSESKALQQKALRRKQGLEDTHYSGVPDKMQPSVVATAQKTIADIRGAPRRAIDLLEDTAFDPRGFGQRQMEGLENLRPADTGGQSLFGGGGFGSPSEIGSRQVEAQRRSKSLFGDFY